MVSLSNSILLPTHLPAAINRRGDRGVDCVRVLPLGRQAGRQQHVCSRPPACSLDVVSVQAQPAHEWHAVNEAHGGWAGVTV